MCHEARNVEKLRVGRALSPKVGEYIMPKLSGAIIVRHAGYKGRVCPMHPCEKEEVQGALSIPVPSIPCFAKFPVSLFHIRRFFMNHSEV